MKLTIKERLAIGGLLPEKGDMVTITIAKDIKSKVELTQKLIKDLNFRSLGNRFTWNEEKKPACIKFTLAEIKILKDRVTELEKKKELLVDNYDLYKKIQDWTEPKCNKDK